MQHPIPNLLRPSLVPELAPNVAAGTPGHVHLRLIHVATLRAAPHELSVFLHDLDLSVPAAALAVIALGVQLGIDDVVVDKLDDAQHSRQIVLHIGHLDVADGTARRQGLELGFKPQLLEGVDLLCHMDMVAVGNIIPVSYARNDPKTPLEGLGELIGGGLQGSTIQAEIDVAGRFPGLTGIVEAVHNGNSEGFGLRISVTLAGHVLHALVEAGVAQGDGRISIEQEFVNDLAFLQPGQSTVLPQDRRKRPK